MLDDWQRIADYSFWRSDRARTGESEAYAALGRLAGKWKLRQENKRAANAIAQRCPNFCTCGSRVGSGVHAERCNIVLQRGGALPFSEATR